METTATINQAPEAKATTVEAPVHQSDKYIWAVYIFLCIVSIIEIYSASSREVSATNIFGPILRQGMHLAVDTLIVYGISRIPYRWFIPMTPLFVGLSVILMLYVLVAGDIINGARRCFTVMGIQMQPSEMIKMSAVLFIALIMSRNLVKQGVTNKGVICSAIAVIGFGGLLFSQGLTNTILLMFISLSMMLIAGIQWKKFLLVCLAYGVVAAGGMAYKVATKGGDDAQATTTTIVTSDGTTTTTTTTPEAKINRSSTWKERMVRWLGIGQKPLYEQDITPKNRQEMYGYMAQANGGWHGVLPGNSRETARLPLAFSDYIFSIIVEDWGFIGGIILMIVYLSLLARAGNIARRCSRAFPAFLVLGMAVMITFQALFHMAIVTGVFPVSGQPLPMISKGGSSMLVTAIAFGVMLSVSRYAVRNGKSKDIKQEKEALPESVRADNPSQI